MRAQGLVAAAVLGVVLAPAPAWGKCAAPAAVIVPPDGAVVPAKPVLYVFIPTTWGKQPPETLPLAIVDGAGAKVSFKVARLGEAPAFAAYRVDVDARAGSRITARLTYRAHREAAITRSYSVLASWSRPPRGPTAVTKVERQSREWTCSHHSTRNLTPSRFAPAYRVEWAATPEEWRRGARGRVFLPYSIREFWRWGDDKVPAVALLELGHLNCMGFSFQWNKKSIVVGIAALHPDGSEDPPVAEPVRVSPP